MTEMDVSPLPESTRRGATPTRPITLADGRSWGLALPTPRYRPEVVSAAEPVEQATGTIRLTTRTGYPWWIEQLVEELRSACQTGRDAAGEGRRYQALMNLAVSLLRRAHHLTLAEAMELLVLDDEGLICLVDAVLAAVAGIAVSSSPGLNLPPTGGGDAFRS